MKYLIAILLAGSALLTPISAYAQLDEVVVTGMRQADEGPGLFLEKRGDYLLLEVSIENDSREFTVRIKEINETVQMFMEAAKSDPDITLSIIDENNFVRRLTEENFSDGIRNGSRPDTSFATLKVKTEIPETVEDSYKLATRLAEFVDDIEEKDRTTINTYDEISVSIVNPYQYRSEVIKMVTDEIKTVTTALGPEYRVILKVMKID